MVWALENPCNMTQILKLMVKSVCLCEFPCEYLNLVLKPYVLMISSGEAVPYQCLSHNWKTAFEENVVMVSKLKNVHNNDAFECQLSALSQNIRMMKQDTLRIGQVRLRFYPDRELTRNLFRLDDHRYIPASFGLNPKFILFNEDRCMKKYPVWSTCNLNVNELRELVATNQNLSVMLFKQRKGGSIY